MPKKSLSEQGIIHLFSQQRKIHHLLNITHIMEHQAFQILRFDLIDILLILLAKNQLLDPGSTLPRSVISPVIAKFFFTLR